MATISNRDGLLLWRSAAISGLLRGEERRHHGSVQKLVTSWGKTGLSATQVLERAPTETAFAARLRLYCERFLEPSVLLRIVLYLLVIIYLRTITFDYVYDDNWLIVTNPWMQSWKYVPTIFTHSFWSFTDMVRIMDFYRPMVMLALVSTRLLLGPAPGWFHILAVGLHVSATYLTYRLAVEATGDRLTAAIAAGVFGLHPTKVETAAWICDISDSLCAVFFLGSMIGYFQWKKHSDTKHGAKYLAASLALLLLALFSKEAAVFAPLLIAIYELASSHEALGGRLRSTLKAVWSFAVITLVATVIRIWIVPLPRGVTRNETMATVLTAPEAILWYLGKQVWPAGLSINYPKLLITNFSFGGFVFPLLVLLALSIVVILAVRKSAAGIFFASWYLLMLAPTITYHVRLQEHDRYFYLASVASSIAAAYLLTKLRRFGAAFQGTIVAAIFAAAAAASFNYCSYWENDIKIFTRALQIAPHNRDTLIYLAYIYMNPSHLDKAEAMALELTKDPETRALGWFTHSNVSRLQGNYEGARRDLQKAMEYSNHSLTASLALIDVDLLLSRNEEAIHLCQEQLRLHPEEPHLRDKLAVALRATLKPGAAPPASQKSNPVKHSQ